MRVLALAATFVLAVFAGSPYGYIARASANASQVSTIDCTIVFERTDGSSLNAYVWNANATRRVRVTIATYASGFPRTERLPDQVYEAAPGERVFIGGTVANGTRFSYYVVGVQFID